jgi:hypothetical protein
MAQSCKAPARRAQNRIPSGTAGQVNSHTPIGGETLRARNRFDSGFHMARQRRRGEEAAARCRINYGRHAPPPGLAFGRPMTGSVGASSNPRRRLEHTTRAAGYWIARFAGDDGWRLVIKSTALVAPCCFHAIS